MWDIDIKNLAVFHLNQTACSCILYVEGEMINKVALSSAFCLELTDPSAFRLSAVVYHGRAFGLK